MFYYYDGFKFIEAIRTPFNPNGMGCLDSDPECKFFVVPDQEIGKICIKNFHNPRKELVKAHKHQVSELALHSESKLIATASKKVKGKLNHR